MKVINASTVFTTVFYTLFTILSSILLSSIFPKKASKNVYFLNAQNPSGKTLLTTLVHEEGCKPVDTA